MKLPAISSFPLTRSALLLFGAFLALPSLAAEPEPRLSRLLFEVAPAADLLPGEGGEGSAAGSTPTPGEEAAAALAPPDEDEDSVLSRIAEYERALADLEETYGPYTQDLTEELHALGKLYEQAGNHGAAIATYEKAVHILRVNNGLFTLEQISLVEDIIRNYQATHDFREADNRQEYLYYLKQKNYQDGQPEMIRAMFDWADWNVQAYYRRLEENESPSISIHQSVGPTNSEFIPVMGPNNMVYYVPRNQAFSSSYAINNSLLQAGLGSGMSSTYLLDPRLRTARDLYEEIAEQIEGDDSATGDALLPETEKKLANISYIVKQEMDSISRISTSSLYSSRAFRPQQIPEVSRGYVKGKDSLEKVLENLRADPSATPVEIAEAIIDLGDWQLSFDRPQAAFSKYEEAHALLREAGLGNEAIEAIFAPRPAVEIPTYATHRYSRPTLGIPPDAEVEYLGYIDIQLSVDKYGNTRRPQIVEFSQDTPGDVREALLDHVRAAKLRPRLVEGEVVEQNDLMLRYYYSY